MIVSVPRTRTPAFRARRLRILRADPTCWLCHEPIDLSIKWPDDMAGTVDHVVPWSKGGSDHPSNLRSCHNICNRKRQAKPAHEVAKLKTSRSW